MEVLDVVGRSIADGAGMFWETLWALVLGFGLSGAVQAFVSREQMQRALGDHRPVTLARAGFFGAISSSCSYAASALAKTLFVRGADFTAAQAFMFASTNLVVELGIVLWLLIGWPFALAEFVGGALMVALLGVLLPRVVSPEEQHLARRRLAEGADSDAENPHAHHGQPAHGQPVSGRHPSSRTAHPRPRITTLAGWSAAAGYTVSDLTMLRREMLIGFLVAGFADAAVPVDVWKSLFLTGHGFWSALENVILGPFLAIISFVCSIGNVPLAAALWAGGISFGGTVAFVFADLLAFPLLAIYRKYYGTRLTLKLLAVFWLTMSVAGLIVEYLFTGLGIVPDRPPALHGHVGRDVFGWNYTTVLDIIALVAFALLYWLYRQRHRFGSASRYAKDPMCGMQVEIVHAPASRVVGGVTYYFCSDHCAHRFSARSTEHGEKAGVSHGHHQEAHVAHGHHQEAGTAHGRHEHHGDFPVGPSDEHR
ncbi:MAG: permease [Acidothermus sp.]|nr:permease [Acidothermus sp.]